MESTRFDSLTRGLAATDSRRGAFKTVAAAGLGLGIARLGLGSALAGTKKELGQRCRRSRQCKGELVCKVARAYEDCFPNEVKRCCIPLGERCEHDCDCCGVGRICNGHVCQSA